MINFDGALLMDIMSMTGPAYGTNQPDMVDGVDVYKYELVDGPERDGTMCEGCGYDPEGNNDRRMYASFALTEESYDTMAPVLSYCQVCMEDLKKSYDEDPMHISAHGSIHGAPWWHPLFLSGHANNVWKEME